MNEKRLSRRSFLRRAALLAGGAALFPSLGMVDLLRGAEANEYGRNTFYLARIIYNGSWDAAFPNSDLNLSGEFRAQAGRRFETDLVQVTLSDEALFRYPILYITGFSGTNVFTLRETEALRKHLINGGFLFASDCGGGGPEFRDSIRNLINNEVFAGDKKLQYVTLPDEEHPVFNMVVPFDVWSPGLYVPGRYSYWEYDGRMVCFMAAEFDNNCILAYRAADARITQQCLWQGVNVLYYAMTV
jgi:hypothetical protein